MIVTKEALEKSDACAEGKAWGLETLNLKGGIEAKKLWPKFDRADWLMWALWHTESVNIEQLIMLSVVTGRLSLKYARKEDLPVLQVAFDAAEAVARENTQANRSAAWSAWSAAWSAESAARSAWSAASAAARSAARSAAWSAAWSAWSAARSAARSAAESAESAARSAESAARSAESAAWSAWSAAWSAAHKEMCAMILAEMKKPYFKKLGKPTRQDRDGKK